MAQGSTTSDSGYRAKRYVDWTKQLACRGTSLECFGFSAHSTMGKMISGDGRCVTVKQFRPREGHRLCEKDLESALKKWKEVSSHANIQTPVGLFGANFYNSPLVLITPYIDWNLLDYIHANPNVDKLALVYTITSALEYIHSKNLTHGGVKGSNILVDVGGTIYISDIGIYEALSSPGRVEYDTRWRAPERVLNGHQDTPTCDVWSLGMTILEMYTGRHPFYNHAREETIVLAMERGDIPLRPQNDVITDEVWVLLLECWEYTPFKRPSMEEIRERISSLKDEIIDPLKNAHSVARL